VSHPSEVDGSFTKLRILFSLKPLALLLFLRLRPDINELARAGLCYTSSIRVIN
jgi:hypothetical protein